MMDVRRATNDTDIAACLAIRRVVFIEGQSVPEAEEVDGQDSGCLHYIGRINGRPVATARVMSLPGKAKIQRVAVLEQHQSAGLGSQLMTFILEDLRARHAFETATLGSQTHAIPFYEKLGFVAHGPEYDDAGIPHRDMDLTL